jgi:hypothetical protein
MRSSFWVMPALLLAAGSAAAQQSPCRPYRAGDNAPPGCQTRQRATAPAYQSWGGGFGATTATPQSSAAAPAPRPDWRYFGGYNAAYGFGR